jgi:phosphoribosylpyrophosphate synthetase
MKIKNPEDIVIVTVGQTDEEFAQSVADYVGKDQDILTTMVPRIFTGGEYNPKFIFENGSQGLNGKTVYLIATQGAFQNPQDMAMRVCIASRAAKENGAKNVILIATDLSYSRQDRGINEDPKMLGEANTAKLFAELLKLSGVDETITIHLHNSRVAKYHDSLSENGEKRIFNIQPASLFSHYLLEQSSLKIENEGENLVFISPDSGAEPFVREIRRQMFLPKSSMLLLNKVRKVPNHPGKITIDNPRLENGDKLEGKIGILPDDIVDTGGTLIKVIDWLFEDFNKFGKLKDLLLCFSHPVLGGKSYKTTQSKLAKKPQIREFIMLATRPFIVANCIFRFKGSSTILRIPNFFGDIIIRHNNGENLEESYVFNNKREMMKAIKHLYVTKRSSKHFMEKHK